MSLHGDHIRSKLGASNLAALYCFGVFTLVVFSFFSFLTFLSFLSLAVLPAREPGPFEEPGLIDLACEFGNDCPVGTQLNWSRASRDTCWLFGLYVSS